MLSRRFTPMLALLIAMSTAPAGWTQDTASTAAAYLLLTKADEAINSLDYKYDEVVDQLQRAIKEDPRLLNARLHLAYFYLDQYVMTPEEKEAERNAFLRKTLGEWIEAHPISSDAIWNMVWFQTYCERSIGQAWKWAHKLKEIAPGSVQANYAIAFLAAANASTPIYDALLAAGISVYQPQSLPDAKVRQRLRLELAPFLDEGLKAVGELTAKRPARPLDKGPAPPSLRDQMIAWSLKGTLLRFKVALADPAQSGRLQAEAKAADQEFEDLFAQWKKSPGTERTQLKPDEPPPGVVGPPGLPPPPPPPPPPPA